MKKMIKPLSFINKAGVKVSALAFAMFCVASFNAVAQVGERRNDFAVGVSGGYLMNKMNFDPTIKQKQKGATTFGFSARYVCEKYFSSICAVQLELNLSNLGWEEVIEDGSLNTYSRDLSYVQVPMLMQMGWGRERRGLKFLFEAGPQIGFCIGSKENKGGETWDTSNRPNGVTYQYGKDPDNKFDYGITAGLGLELSTGIGHFLLDGRYYYGLGDVFDNSKKGDFSRSASQTITVKLTYLFDIVKTKRQ